MSSRTPANRKLEMSIVVASHNEGAELRATVDSILACSGDDAELIVVDDRSDDGSTDFLANSPRIVHLVPEAQLGVAAARNVGARAARGETIVFCDAHVRVHAGWHEALQAALEPRSVGAVAPAIARLEAPAVRGYGFTWTSPDLVMRWLPKPRAGRQPVPFLGGACVAVRRDTFEEAGGFDEGCVRWGAEDAEFSLRLWRLGYECQVVSAVTVAHQFRTQFPYAVDWSATVHNLLRLATVHFEPPALQRVVDVYSRTDGFPSAYARLADSDVWERRRDLSRPAIRSARWFFRRFAMEAFL